jgi:hypothetical protein
METSVSATEAELERLVGALRACDVGDIVALEQLVGAASRACLFQLSR